MNIRHHVVETIKKARLYLKVGRTEAAVRVLKNALKSHGNLANVHNLLGVSYLKASKFSEAAGAFQEACNCNPNYMEAQLNLILTLCDLGLYEDARERYYSFISSGVKAKIPDQTLGQLANQHVSCGSIYYAAEMYGESIQEYKKALQLYPKMPDVRLKLSRLYIQSGQLEHAKKELESLVKDYPNYSEACNHLGILYLRQGRLDHARMQWEKALIANSFDVKAKSYLAFLDSDGRSTQNSSYQ